MSPPPLLLMDQAGQYIQSPVTADYLGETPLQSKEELMDKSQVHHYTCDELLGNTQSYHFLLTLCNINGLLEPTSCRNMNFSSPWHSGKFCHWKYIQLPLALQYRCDFICVQWPWVYDLRKS